MMRASTTEAMVIPNIAPPPIPDGISTFLDTPMKEQMPKIWVNATLLTNAELMAITSKSFIRFYLVLFRLFVCFCTACAVIAASLISFLAVSRTIGRTWHL